MTPQEDRNQKLAERMIKNLNRRNMEAFYCPTGKEAVKKVSELIADGSTVTWGGTATVRDLGIPEVLKNRGTLEVLDRDLAETPEEKEARWRHREYRRQRQPCGRHHVGTEEGYLRHRTQQGGPDGRGCTGQGPQHGITRQCPAVRHQSPLQDRRHLP